MSHTPEDALDPALEQVLDLAEDALDQGDAATAVGLCEEVLESAPNHPGASFLRAEALRDLGALEDAEAGYRQLLHVLPEHSPSWSALGWVLFDQLRLAEAGIAALRAIRLDAFNAEAYRLRAMLRERRKDMHGADRDFLRAARLDPDLYPLPLRLDDATVEAVVEEVLRELPETIRAYMGQVAILLEEVPEESVCLEYDPPAPPGDILGYFAGVSLMERSIENPWSNLPSAIVLFRRNLERIAWDRARLIEELRITVFHEVGHFLGLSEQDLAERGLQ